MKKLSLLLSVMTMLWSTLIFYGQEENQQENSPTDLPTILPPSPTVASLMRFEEVPIDNYSGKPNIVFPIYTKQLAQGVVVPVALRYNTMALRVDERSGWAGTGWALDGEAVISRTVRGVADELDQVNIHPDNHGHKSVGVYHNGYYDLNWGTYLENQSDYDIQNFLWNASGKGSGQFEGVFDKDPDLYQLSLFGVSARFVIIKKPNQTLEVQMIENDANVKIDLVYNADFSIVSFEVTNTNGVKYFFNVKETTHSHSENSSLSQKEVHAQHSFGSSGYMSELSYMSDTDYVSSWKIKNIKLSNDTVLATFNYQDVFEEFNPPISSTTNKIESFHTNIWDNWSVEYGVQPDYYSIFGHNGEDDPYGIFGYNDGVALPKVSWSKSNLKIQTKKIQTIVFNDLSEIEFITSLEAHPEYINSGVFLNEIIIKNASNQQFKRFVIHQSTSANNRLFIDSIDEFFNSELLQYTFNYLDKDELPSFNDDRKDIWGYYKGDFDPIPIYQVIVDKNKVKTGVLTSINYPNGGIKTFEFESNTISYNGSSIYSDDEFATRNPDNWIKLNASENFTLNGINVSNEVLNFTLDVEQSIYGVPTINNIQNNTVAIEDLVFKIYRLEVGQDPILVTEYAIEYPSLISLPSGNYSIRLATKNASVNGGGIYDISTIIYYKNIIPTISKFLYGGGLRIKKISFIDGFDNSIQKDKIYYYNENSSTLNSTISAISSGVVDGRLTNTKQYLVTKAHNFARRLGMGNILYIIPSPVDVIYKVTENLNSVFTAMTKNNYVGYAKVTIKELNNGKAVFHYSTAKEHPTGISVNYPFFPLVDKSYLQGNIQKQEVYNDVGNLLTKTDFVYHEPIVINVIKSLHIYSGLNDGCPYVQFYATFEDYLNRTPSLGRDSMWNYQQGNNCITNIPNIVPDFYNFRDVLNYNKLLLKDKITKQYHYDSLDTPPDPFFPVLPDPVVTTESYTYNLENYLPSIIEKTDSNNNIFKTETIYSVTGYPTSDFTSEENTNISLMIDKNMIDKPILSKSYKNNNLLSSVKATYEEFLSGLILPNKVKTSKGNDPLEDRLTYHAYDDFGNVLDVSQIEGTHISYVYGYQHQLPIAKIVNMEYADLPQSELNALLNFNYIIGTEAQLLTVLNNFRNALPENTEVTTLTYKPLIGASTITGPNGETIRYHYDNLNRLMYTEDHQGNGISKNEYHYKGQN
jgi:hypothetical protein